MASRATEPRELGTGQLPGYGTARRRELRERPEARQKGRIDVTSSVPPARAHRTDPLVGTVMNGKYRVAELVASGGMGKVYRGEQLSLGRPVAIKVLHAVSTQHLDDPLFQKRFFREASILSRLQHPNIVTVFDYGQIEGDDERYFMAMEFLSGHTLHRRICDRVMLAPGDVIRIARQIASGLGEAHAHGVVHRDLKPSNVMLARARDGTETVKLLDFGIVKILGEDDSNDELTKEGSFLGSPRYMAPEQITRGGNIDARTDIYSLGIILYQCLSGAVPFDEDSAIQTMMAHLHRAPLPLQERAPGANVPDWLDDIVMACLSKEPSQRPSSMAAVARRLADGEAMYPPVSGDRVPGRAVLGIATPPSNVFPPVNALAITQDPASAGTAGAARPVSQNEVDTVDAEAIQSVPPRDDIDRTRASARLPPKHVSLSPLPFAVGAGVMLIAVLVAIGLRSESARAPAPGVTAASAPGPKRSFSLVVESDPGGADVIEAHAPANVVLGTTPIHLTIDNGIASPRKLILQLRGYQPYTIVQGASDEDVRIVARLVPEASPESPSVVTSAPSAGTVRARAGDRGDHGDATDARDRKKLDIRLSR
jgi:serine/threonine-protein kinase